MFLWETMDNYLEHEKIFSVNSDSINEAENITSLNDHPRSQYYFKFKQETGKNIDHLAYRVQLLEAIFNEFAKSKPLRKCFVCSKCRKNKLYMAAKTVT